MIFWILFFAVLLFMPFGYLISKRMWRRRGNQLAAELDLVLKPDELVQTKTPGKITQGLWTSNAMIYVTKDRVIWCKEVIPLLRKVSAIALRDISEVRVRKMWFVSATVQIKYGTKTLTFYPTKDGAFPDSTSTELLAATIERARAA